MKIQNHAKITQYDDVWFGAAKQRISADVDGFIAGVDSGSSKAALAYADASLEAAANEIRSSATMRAVSALVEAAGSVVGSAARLGQIAKERAELSAELAGLPVTSFFQLFWALCFIGAALAAFFTELQLTNTLTYLLGFNADDPTGRAMGAAFAASLLVFELVFERLNFTDDPWKFFARSDEREAGDRGSPIRPQGARHVVSAAIAVMLLGIALLQSATIVKMAPTREIAGKLRANPLARLTPTEEQEIKQSVLFFSLCVLISGAFMAAVGKKEINTWFLHRKFEKRVKYLAAEERTLLQDFNTKERPRLAARLRTAGLPFMWLLAAPLADIPHELSKIQSSFAEADSGKAANADHEATAFLAAKRNALDKASEKPAPRPRRSTVEIVDDIIRGVDMPCSEMSASATSGPSQPPSATIYQLDRPDLTSLRSPSPSQQLA